MTDLISKQAVIKAIEDLPNCYNGFSDTYDKACIVGVIEELPTIDPVKHGKWRTEYGRYGRSIYCCSECRNYSSEDFPFCHWCGAKMYYMNESPCENCDERSDVGCCWCKKMER